MSLLGEFIAAIGLRELIEGNLPQPGSNRGYKPWEYTEAMIYMLMAGGSSLEDIRELRREEELLKEIGLRRLPSSDAMGLWLRRMEALGGLQGLEKVVKQINERIMRFEGRQEYTLDVDATEVVAQKQEAAYTYKGNKGYMPVFGFLYENSLCIYDEFRNGNESPGARQLEFYRKCKEQMPKGKRIRYYRADSASYQAGLINELEADGVYFTITADMDSAVKETIRRIEETEWYEPYEGCGYEVAEAVHSMNRTEKAFRLIVKRQVIRQMELFEGYSKYKYYAVASNFPEEEAAHEVLEFHNKRGQCENYIKEIKEGFSIGRMPSSSNAANAVYMRIAVLGYNLFVGFKRIVFPVGWHKHRVSTFRWKVFVIGGRVVRHAKRIVLKLAVGIRKLRLLEEVRRKIVLVQEALSSG